MTDEAGKQQHEYSYFSPAFPVMDDNSHHTSYRHHEKSVIMKAACFSSRVSIVRNIFY